MELSEAKLEFELRYYRWAISEWEKEINESFPNLCLFKAGSFHFLHQFMQSLGKEEQLVLAHSLLKRFHPEAVKKLEINTTEEEIALRDRCGKFRNDIFINEMEKLQARRKAGEKIKFVSKAKLRKAMVAKFQEVYGPRCVRIELGEGWDPQFDVKICGWVVSTQLWFGRSESLIQYTQSIVSEHRVPHHVIPNITVPTTEFNRRTISFGDWLGIQSQTQWEHLLPENVEPACSAALKLCGRFFDAAQNLLKGLEPENISAN